MRGALVKKRGEQAMVPQAEFTSYYGRAVLKEPVWQSPEVPGYLFLGGLAGASSVLAGGAQVRGCPDLARGAKLGAAAAISLSAAALIADLGRPERFVNMLRVFKPTSPMSVGSWLLAAYGPAAGAAALSAVTGIVPAAGSAATAAAAVLGCGVSTYTAALICDTAVPAWHNGYREMPYLFAGSAASAAGGLGLLAAPNGQAGPARRLAVLGAAAEITSAQLLTRRIGMTAEPYRTGRSGFMFHASEVATACALGVAFIGRRHRAASAIAGATLLAASATTRFAIFRAGRTSARDPKYTIVPQRERLNQRSAAERSAAERSAAERSAGS
jgi:DMSO reductase anchor subunit